MQPFERAQDAWLQPLRGLLFDLDDTLLDHGRLLPEALGALYRLRDAGFDLYAVTGRPASWGAVATHQWPLTGAIAENGAILFERVAARVKTIDPIDPAERAHRRERLARAVETLRRNHPELEPADDVGGRISDFTFDIGEHRNVDPAIVERARASARALGATTATSSVHLHVSFDRADKASGAVRLLHKHTALDPSLLLARYAFIGDSENDAACFAAFRVTLGVKNLRGRPTLPPRFLLKGERAEGFVEAAELLLARRRKLG
jgi:hypothetical protein